MSFFAPAGTVSRNCAKLTTNPFLFVLYAGKMPAGSSQPSVRGVLQVQARALFPQAAAAADAAAPAVQGAIREKREKVLAEEG